MTLTLSMVDVAVKIYDKLIAQQGNLGIGVVYYGDQARIETTPAVCVEPSVKNNNLNSAAAARKIDPIIETSILVYHSAIQSPQQNRLEADQFGEAIEAYLNTQRDLDGLVIHAYVSVFESGYLNKGDTVMRACRLTHLSRTQGYLPS